MCLFMLIPINHVLVPLVCMYGVYPSTLHMLHNVLYA